MPAADPSLPTRPLTRRTLLRAGGVGSLGLLLAACTSDDPGTAGGEDVPAAFDEPLADGEDIARRALDAAGVDAELGLTPIVATFELLTVDGRVPFGILGTDNQPILDGDVRAWVVDGDGTLTAGPITPLFHGEGLGTRGVYVAELDLPAPGIHDLVLVAETPDGPRAGTAALRVVDPADSTTFPPGTTLPEVATPTLANPGPLVELCTAEPDCTMHATSAAEVLGRGPVVLTISTPAYCQTAVCGPVVQVVQAIRDELGRDDVTFIHAEVYEDAGETPTQPVVELGLPSEPWTWVVGADGVVVDRFDGPLVPQFLRDAINRV